MKRAVLLVALLVVFAGCSENSHTSSMHGYTPSKEDVVASHGKLKNLERIDQFMENVKSGSEDEVRVVGYTKEGDPILHDLAYNGKQIHLTYDTTRDEYGDGDIFDTTSDSFEKAEIESNITYFLSGCRQTDEFGGDISILEIEK